MLKQAMKLILLPVAAAVVVACGGGGGGGSASSPVTLTGVAAYGAPYPQGSKLTVIDGSGKVIIDGQEITSIDGSYSLAIPATAVAPFIISVTADELPSLVSLVPQKADGIANVTPITNLIASHLSNSGNPADLAAEISSGNQMTAVKVASKTAEVKAVLAPLLSSADVTADPLTGAFKADGTGMDRVLDALKLDVIPVAGASNIVIGLKTALQEDELPIELAYSRGAGTSGDAPSLASLISAADLSTRLAPSGISVKIDDWSKRMMACHAENINTRVNLKNTNNATASNIISSICKDLFINSDPAAYFSHGYGITGRDHFSGIFWDAGTDLKSSNVQLEYIVKSSNTTDVTKPMNGDVVFSYRWRTTDDKTDVSVAQGRVVNGKLQVTGNLSQWDVGVNPRVEKKVFTQTNMVDRTYLNTGYSIYANANKHGVGTNPVLYIKVTTPNNKTLHLKQRDGYDYYVLVANPSAANTTGLTSVLRMSSAYLNPSIAGSPRDMDNHLFWGKNPDSQVGDWTDAQLAAIPNQGNWKFEMYSNVNGTLLGTAVRRTISRAPTIAETKLVNWPQITNAGLDKIATSTASSSSGSNLIRSESNISLAGLQGEDFWSVASDTTWLPTGARLSGAYFPGGFCSSADISQNNWTNVNGTLKCDRKNTTDNIRFRSNVRKITVPCSQQGVSDDHCSAVIPPNNAPRKFKANNAYSFSNLWGFDSRRVENSLSIDTRKTEAPL
jgi:hypothetical protein